METFIKLFPLIVADILLAIWLVAELVKTTINLAMVVILVVFIIIVSLAITMLYAAMKK